MSNFKISKDVSIFDAAPYDFIISSDYTNMQLEKVINYKWIAPNGEVNILHELKYTPYVMVMIYDCDNFKNIAGNPATWENGYLLPTLTDGWLFNFWVNKENIKLYGTDYLSGTQTWYFRIFIFTNKIE